MGTELLDRRALLRRMAVVAVGALLGPRRLRAAARPLPHPDPRPDVTAEHVLAEDKLPDRKNVREAFQFARTYPQIFDGIYCPCECSEVMHHRSLLTCFESTQPIGCWSCKDAASFIGPMARDGKSLAEIREAVDKKYG